MPLTANQGAFLLDYQKRTGGLNTRNAPSLFGLGPSPAIVESAEESQSYFESQQMVDPLAGFSFSVPVPFHQDSQDGAEEDLGPNTAGQSKGTDFADVTTGAGQAPYIPVGGDEKNDSFIGGAIDAAGGVYSAIVDVLGGAKVTSIVQEISGEALFGDILDNVLSYFDSGRNAQPEVALSPNAIHMEVGDSLVSHTARILGYSHRVIR